jgi:hypothetical protein
VIGLLEPEQYPLHVVVGMGSAPRPGMETGRRRTSTDRCGQKRSTSDSGSIRPTCRLTRRSRPSSIASRKLASPPWHDARAPGRHMKGCHS